MSVTSDPTAGGPQVGDPGRAAVGSMAAHGADGASRSLRYVSADEVEAYGYPAAVRALELALRSGLRPGADPARSTTKPDELSSLLFMPSFAIDGFAGVKLVTIDPRNPAQGLPLIHGMYLLFDRPGLVPRAVLDGTALTTLRTPAMSLAAVRPVLRRFTRPLRVVIFGIGPQGLGHLDALAQVAAEDGDIPNLQSVTFVARRDPSDRLPHRAGIEIASAAAGSPKLAAALADADVIVCATASSTPVLDAGQVGDQAVVMAVGTSTADATEVDPALCGRATVIVEDAATAMRECGEIVHAVDAGVLHTEHLIEASAVVRGCVSVGPGPVLFKGSGMAWQDLAVAAAILRDS